MFDGPRTRRLREIAGKEYRTTSAGDLAGSAERLETLGQHIVEAARQLRRGEPGAFGALTEEDFRLIAAMHLSYTLAETAVTAAMAEDHAERTRNS